jgi:O-antigen ligase
MNNLASRSDAFVDSAPTHGTASLRPSRMRLVLVFLFLLFGGLAVSLVGNSLIDRYGSPLVFALVILGPPLLIYLAWNSSLGLTKFRVLWHQLRWYHFLWLFVLASSFVIRLRDVQGLQNNPLDAAALYRVVLVGITALTLTIRLVLRRTKWMSSMFRGLVGIMAVYALMCVLSTLWSVNAPFTFYKSLEYLDDVALLAAILVTVNSIKSFETLFDWTWVLIGLLVVSAWIEAPIWPAEALEEGYMAGVLKFRLTGIFPGQGSNGLGSFGAIIAVVAFARLLPTAGRKFDKGWYSFVLLLGVATMVCTQTRAAMGGFLLGALLVLIYTNRMRISAALGMLLAGVMGVSGFGAVFWDFLRRGQSRTEMLSLTGRVQWWSVAWQVFKQRPFSGFGAYAAPFAVWGKMGEEGFGPLHSDYVETLVGNGIWGPLPIIIALLGTWWILLKFLRHFPAGSLERQLAVESIAVLAVVTTRSVIMNLIIFHPPIQYFVVLGYAEYLRRRLRDHGSLAPPAEASASRLR